MHRRVVFAAALVGSATFISAAAQAAKAPPLPSCTIASLGAAVEAIVPHTLPGTVTPGLPVNSVFNTPQPFVQVVAAQPEVPSSPPPSNAAITPVGPTPAYCQVAFIYSSGLNGPADGYDVGYHQQIQVLINLPLSKADGGNEPAGVEGNWNGGVMTSGSFGQSTTLNATYNIEGLGNSAANAHSGVSGYGYAIRLGYIGTATDQGQTAAAAAHSDILITSGSALNNTIAKGTAYDWAYRGVHYGKQWGDAIAKVYYGKEPKRHYYNGSSGGGNMGMGQLMHFGDEYDGILMGGPANYYTQGVYLPSMWQNLVFRKLVQLGGTLPTSAQALALYNSAVAACDVIPGIDNVADGIIADARWCNFSATANICGMASAPASPNCLTADQALSFDRVWDGPRNSHGARIWYAFGKQVPMGQAGLPFTPSLISSNVTSNGLVPLTPLVQWDHLNAAFPVNNCVFADQESLALATTNAPASGPNAWGACTSPGTPTTFEDEATLNAINVAQYTDNMITNLKPAMEHGTKVIHFDGGADGIVFWNNSPAYYKYVAKSVYGGTTAADLKKLQSWYRLFEEPSVGHVTGSNGGQINGGPSIYDPFIVLRNWVEHDIVPKSVLALAGGSAAEPGRTRPLCPYPQTAIYSGYGSTDDAASFTCGGNLESTAVACNDVRTVFKQENTANLDYASLGLTAKECASHLPPPNAATPTSP
jgi:hypothetical protein